MKSLMEEASSIAKAIEQGWIRAGKPKEFTVKVHEEPVKNFFGWTTQPAKVGIFFTETRKTELKRKAKQQQQQPRKPREEKPKKAPEELGPIWDDAMVTSAEQWVGTLLKHMGITASYKVVPSRFHLRVEFSDPVLSDKDKQKHLFAVLSGLLMTMLKREYKRPLRGYKIVLTEV